MTMYMTMKWTEPRLEIAKVAANQTIMNSRKGRELLWFPDVAMRNLVSFKIKNTLSDIEGITIHKGSVMKCMFA